MPPIAMQRDPAQGSPETSGPVAFLLSLSEEERRRIALTVAERHRKGKAKRRLIDLTAEKFLIHVDGENDGQYADIINGMAVMVPPKLGSTLRLQQNLLRPMVENFVAYHTAIPFKVVAEAPLGRRGRDRARIDTLLGNHFIQDQKLNSVLAEAMYFAAVYGHCPVHCTWRYNMGAESFHPFGLEDGIQPGYVDVWVGDPWDTVYNDGATRNSVHRLSYGRVVPAKLIRNSFGHLPWADQIKGNDALPSASRFQRIARRWHFLNQYSRSSNALSSGESNEEMVGIISEELAPGINPEWPDGRLTLIALAGSSSTDRWSSGGASAQPLLLHVGPLPGKRFSVTRFYAQARYDDVGGKAYVADLDDLQIQLNNIITLRAERLKKFAMPQLLVMDGSVEPDSLWGDPNIPINYSGIQKPEYMSPPNMSTAEYDLQIKEIESQMFRIGGWQAASRGESFAGDPAAKVVALGKADDTIFGPINRSFQDSLNELLCTARTFVREYADMPLLARVSGEEMGYAIEPWINPQNLEPDDPIYRVVSGFGSTPEALAQTLTNLATTVTPAGPLLGVDEFWERYPDPSLKPHRPNTKAVKRRRLNTINYFIEKLCNEAGQQFEQEVAQNPKMMLQLAQSILNQVNAYYPPLRTDDIAMVLESLDELVHDTTVSGLCRTVCEMRQNQYFEWLMMQEAAAAPPPISPQQDAGNPPPGGGGGQRPSQPNGSKGSGTPRQGSQFGGTRTSEFLSPQRTKGEVENLTSAANAGETR